MKKQRGYQKRLYQRRGKCLESDKEKKLWGQLSELYMTEESEDEEAGVVRKHHIPWQSDALREAKAILDERVKKRVTRAGQFASKERLTSSPSTSPIPLNPVKWAVNRIHLNNNSMETFDESSSSHESHERPNRSSVSVNGNTNRSPLTQPIHLRGELNRSEQEYTSIRNSFRYADASNNNHWARQQISRDSLETRTPELKNVSTSGRPIQRNGVSQNYTTPIRHSSQHRPMPPASLFSNQQNFGHSSSHSGNTISANRSSNSFASNRINGRELSRFFECHSSEDETD